MTLFHYSRCDGAKYGGPGRISAALEAARPRPTTVKEDVLKGRSEFRARISRIATCAQVSKLTLQRGGVIFGHQKGGCKFSTIRGV